MRLHRLEVSAFVAFPGRETVDFDTPATAAISLIVWARGESGDRAMGSLYRAAGSEPGTSGFPAHHGMSLGPFPAHLTGD